MEKAGSFIHKPIYSSEATVAEEKNVRGKNYFEFIKLNNSTTLTFLLHYVPLRHNSDFSEYSLHVFTFFFSFFCFPACLCEEIWKDTERLFQKKAEHSWEVKKSEALHWLVNAAQPVWAYPPMFVCVFRCGCVCAGTSSVHVYMCVYLCVCCCVRMRVCVCVQTGLINAAPPSGAMWVEWLVSTSWTFLTLSLPVSGELSTTFTLISSLWAACFAPLDLLWANQYADIKKHKKLISCRPLMWSRILPRLSQSSSCCENMARVTLLIVSLFAWRTRSPQSKEVGRYFHAAVRHLHICL